MDEEEELELLKLQEEEYQYQKSVAAQKSEPTADPKTMVDTLKGYGQDVMSAVTAPARGAAQVFSGAAGDIGNITGWDALRDKGYENKAYFSEDEKKRMDAIESVPLYVGTSILGSVAGTGGASAVSNIGTKLVNKGMPFAEKLYNKGKNVLSASIDDIPNAASTLAQKVATGVGTGFAYGATTPAVSDEQKALIMALSTTGGGALPILTQGVKSTSRGISNFIEPWRQGGNETIAARTMQTAAGPQKSKIVQLLEENKQLPGGQAGAGEVAARSGNAEFPAIQRISEKRQPTTYGRMEANSNAAREELFTNISGGPAEIAKREAAKTARATANYEAANKVAVNGDAELAAILKDPYAVRAANNMSDLAESTGLTGKGSKTNNVTADKASEYLHQLKLSLDAMMKQNSKNPIDDFETSAVRDLQQRLVGWLEAKNPAYAKARTEFATDMVDLDKRRVVQGLRDKMVSPISDMGEASGEAIVTKQNPGALANAQRNEHSFITTVDGSPRYKTLEDAIGKDGVQAVDDASESLARRVDYETLSRRGSSAIKEIIDESAVIPPASGMLHQNYSVFRAVVSGLQGKVRGESMKIMDEAFKNPKQAAELLKRVVPEDQKLVFGAMKNFNDAVTKSTSEGVKQTGMGL